MAAAAATPGIHFAPDDPTLPPPWKALVDGSTGYIYYWNTDTNVTQYEKPLSTQAPLQSGPPLPVGPPPGSTPPAQHHTGPPYAQNGGPVEMNGAINNNLPDSTAVNPLNPGVNTVNSGQSIHGMNNGIVHPAGVPGNAQPNLHVNPGVMVPGNMFGNFNNSTVGQAGGGHMTGSTPGGGHMMGNSPGVNHGTARSAPGMSGAPIHMNATDNSFGGGGRATHSGGLGGAPPGVMNIHAAPIRSMQSGIVVNVPMQPKLAVLPVFQRQQAMGGMQTTVQSRQMNHHGNSGGPIPVGPGPFKRPGNDFVNVEPEPLKRPRMQGFPESTPLMDVDSYRRQHEITVMGDNIPAPIMTFEGANFSPELARELHSAGFLVPTPIQAQSWPLAFQGRDIVAIAKTGSGKTLGYLLPAFLHLAQVRANPQLGPVVLVLSPTRELATQIQDEAVKFGKSSRISCTCVYGGAPKGLQLRDLDRGADIVIATPGRLNDFLEMKKVSLRQVSYLVLDEADRMLDMGFEPQIRKIVKEIPRQRQTLMFTATWPKEVRKIADDLLVKAVQVNIGNTDELVANKSITQYVEIVSMYEKHGKLERILRSQEPGSKIIIFCSTKKMCDQLARSLGRGFGAAAIHGDKSQSERDHVLAQFKSGRSPILVATDVAARGLDIKDIRVVINFDFPTGVEDYVHRIGRTGRAGATGIAFSFFTEQDAKHAKELIGVLEGANQKVPVELRDFAAKSFFPKRGGRWEAGGMGGRDGGYNGGFGGRSAGRGGGSRNDSNGGRGAWTTNGSHFDRRERPNDRYGDKFLDKSGGRDRYTDDKSRSRDDKSRSRDDKSRSRDVRKYGSKDRGRSYSRSPSRSWGRSVSRSRSRSFSRSRSRSRSYDRYSDDRKRWSPYRGRGSYRSRSPRSQSPRSSRSPRHGKVAPAPVDSQPGLSSLPEVKELSPPDPNTFSSTDVKATSVNHCSDASEPIAEATLVADVSIQQVDDGIKQEIDNGPSDDLDGQP